MAKLTHYIRATAQIKLITGMRIGGTKESIKIGGIDNPVIRNPITNLPYIPGSSLKGRFRMALELKYDDTFKNDKGTGPSQNMNHESQVARLFGSGSAQTTSEPTRFIFRDCHLSQGSEDYIEGEEKNELKMDRATMAAFKGQNRIQERIPAGARFDFEVMIRIFKGDDEELFKNRLREAIKFVELEYLGGSGTRGYGQVKFEKLEFAIIEI